MGVQWEYYHGLLFINPLNNSAHTLQLLPRCSVLFCVALYANGYVAGGSMQNVCSILHTMHCDEMSVTIVLF